MSSRNHKKLSPLTTDWNNRSQSSINSDAAVFYSAQAHPTSIELEQKSPRAYSSRTHTHTISSSREHQPTKMDRQDSGFAENISYIPSHIQMRTTSRPSSKSSSYNPRPSLNSPRKSSSRPKDSSGPSSSASSATSRSASKRLPRSSTSPRSNFASRHHHSQSLASPPQYQFFHFPSLSDDLSHETANAATPPPPPPPSTIHYWTSDQTRRLEYAAIDAASKGIRGFVVRCIPDCFLPVEKRGSRFCEEAMRERDDDDAGSVRRYRLVMEDEIENEMKGERLEEKTQSLKEHKRRWSSFIRR